MGACEKIDRMDDSYLLGLWLRLWGPWLSSLLAPLTMRSLP
ncbi:MAG: hypothetical protein U0M15_07130 [Bacillota bacterium]|nr:hypothetical protein [Bacillota bacterium]